MKDTILAEDIQTTTNDYQTERNKPMPSLNHARIQARLIHLLMTDYDEQYMITSELSINLSDWISVPDVALLPWIDFDPQNDQIKVNEVPLCTIEILSPTQTQSDLLAKSRNYFDKGVKSCWIVFPELENIYVFSSSSSYQIFQKGEILNDKKLNIQINLNQVFRKNAKQKQRKNGKL